MAGWMIAAAVSPRDRTVRSASVRGGGRPCELLHSRAFASALAYGRGSQLHSAPRRVKRPLRAGVSDMVRTLLAGISLLVVCAPALAQQGARQLDVRDLRLRLFSAARLRAQA